MKAVILAAGRGTRMGSLADSLPKPMLEVQGRPILQHILEGIRQAGIEEMQIIVGYRGNAISDHFGAGQAFGVQLSYLQQTIQDGTGSAAGLARSFVGADPFILTYGDILVRATTYAAIVARFAAGDCDGVVTVKAGEEIGKGGLVLLDQRGFLAQLIEKPDAEALERLRSNGQLVQGTPLWYNCGIYLFRPSLFEFTSRLSRSPRGEYELTDAVFDMVKAGHKLAGLEIAGSWADVRDPQVLSMLNQ